jgi:hypothetical protein
MLKIICIKLFVVLIFFSSSGICSEYWSRTYIGKESDYIQSVELTADGGYIVVGYTQDNFDIQGNGIWLIKLDKSGAVIWRKAYQDGGSFVNSGFLLKSTSDGGFLAVWNRSFGPGNDNVCVLKLKANGDKDWEKTYGNDGRDKVCAVLLTADGGCLVSGWTNKKLGARNYDIWILKLKLTGEIEWQNVYGGSWSEQAQAVCRTSDGGYLAGGWTYSFGDGERSLWLLKLLSNGEVSWQKTYDDIIMQDNLAIKPKSEDGYAVQVYSLLHNRFDIQELKLAHNGEVLRNNQYYYIYQKISESATAIKSTSDNGFIIAGSMNPASESVGRDIWLIRMNSEGNVVWQRTYGGQEDDYATSVSPTADGGFIVVGWTHSFGANNRTIWVLKIDTNGFVPQEDIFVTRNITENRYCLAKVTSDDQNMAISIDDQAKLFIDVSGIPGRCFVFNSQDFQRIRQAVSKCMTIIKEQKQKNGVANKQVILVDGDRHAMSIYFVGDPGVNRSFVFKFWEKSSEAYGSQKILRFNEDDLIKIHKALEPKNVKQALALLK